MKEKKTQWKLSKKELELLGCDTCFFKAKGKCWHNLKDDERKKK